MWYAILLGLAISALIIALFIRNSIKKEILREIREWKIGDMILFQINADPELINGRTYKLLGWTAKEVFVDMGGYAKRVDMNRVSYNKSYEWRENHRRCFEFMGKNPDFIPGVITSLPKKKDGIPDPSVMSETECEVYLKIALEAEDYLLAEAIQKRLDRFR